MNLKNLFTYFIFNAVKSEIFISLSFRNNWISLHLYFNHMLNTIVKFPFIITQFATFSEAIIANLGMRIIGQR